MNREQAIEKAVRNVLEYLPLESDIPEETHKGICNPETLCDGNCADRAHIFEYNHRVEVLKKALEIPKDQPLSKISGYSEIKKALQNCPSTQVPALIAVLVERAVKEKLFQPGGILRLIGRVLEQNTPQSDSDNRREHE